MITLTDKEKELLLLALNRLDAFYDEQESTCRAFKWICHDYLPQAGEGYVANKNVFDIQDKAINDIKAEKAEARKLINEIINGKRRDQ
jgi:hypothetical protein